MALIRLLLLLSLVASFSDTGSCIDPNGCGSSTDGGGAMDPNGGPRTDEGTGIDPHGRQ